MFDKAEIKRRFELNDRPIDRHGNFVYIDLDFYTSRVQFPLLAHYHLLNGMSDADALTALRDSDMSVFEAKYVLKSSKDFIRDVLGIDLEDVRKSRVSTDGLCGQMITEIIGGLNAVYERKRYAPIEVEGHVFQADAKAREAMLGYLLTDRTVEYWVVENNEQIPLTLDALKLVYASVTERDATLHSDITALKTEGRIYAEKRMYAQLVELSERVKAM